MERTELGALAEGGVLVTSRAVEAGWPRHALSRWLTSRGWARVRNGVWAEPGRTVDTQLRLKAVQAVRPELVVSHGAAARLWRIETLTGRAATDQLEFTSPTSTGRTTLPGARLHRLPLPQTEVVVLRSGLRVTEAPRTLADLLRSGPRDNALVAVDSALGYRRVGGVRRPPLVSPAALAVALEAPYKGAARARQWLTLADRASGSPAETIARLRMHDAGLHPETQAEVRTREGTRRYLDFLFRAQGLAVEIEGYAYHGTRDAHRRDITRFNELLRCPDIHTLLRFTAEDVFHHPTLMIQQIREVLNPEPELG
ncbi:hypothetical protein ACIQ6Y_23495 [Streptomyces sp. NPDC096205]|uniref:hypothetical protein n=1 Tax=Streptomyces sp. NPDC096205 TaxID=3366081 RepID=UPI0037F41E18